MTNQHEDIGITLDVDKGITPHQLAEKIAQQGLIPLFHHASNTNLGRSIMTPKFEDGVEEGLVKMIEQYYEGFLSNAELGNALTQIRLRLFDWTQTRGVEVAAVGLRNLATDGKTRLHPQDEFADPSNEPRVSVFMPTKIPGPNVALHNPFGTGKTELTPNRPIGGEILRKGSHTPRNRAIIPDAGQKLAAKTPRIQAPGETLVINAPVHSSGWSTGHHRHRVPDFQRLDSSDTRYHQLTEVANPHTPPVAMFTRELKE